MHIQKIVEAWSTKARQRLRRSNGSIFRDEGKAAAAQRKWPEAITAYRRHLKLRARDGQTWLRLANALKDSGQSKDAEAAYAKACSIMPSSADAWLNRGHLAKLDGRVDDALDHYMRSFKLDGGSAAGREIHALGYGARSSTMTSAIIGAVDGMVGRTISGWAVDPDNPAIPARIEFLQENERIGEAVANLARADVLSAGFGTSIAGFRANLGSAYRPERGEITIRLSSSRKPLVNSPYQPEDEDSIGRWLVRWEGFKPDQLDEIRSTYDSETEGLTLSILMPVYDPPISWLEEAIDSVRAQLCGRWELICIDDFSTKPEVIDLLDRYAAEDERIKVRRMESNGGIALATNAGLEVASGEYIAFMDHDDVLEPEAVYRMLDAAVSGADLIYSDEIIVGSDLDDIVEIVARPAFSYDYYISHPYFVHFVATRTDIAREIGGLDVSMSISMDVDFVIRIIERSSTIVHVPVPLYRWRTHNKSAGHEKINAVMGATKNSIQRHHDRMMNFASVLSGKTFNTFRTDYDDNFGRVLVVIPTKDRLDLIKPCVESILRTTGDEVDLMIVDHDSSDENVLAYFSTLPNRVRVTPFSGAFNFSKMNNDAVKAYGTDYEFVLFMNNDVEAIEAGWLEHMRGLCQRADVGVVGALLLYGDDHIQHGGVVLGVGGPAEHVHKAEPYDLGKHLNPGYISSLVSVRDYMAVTGACMMMRTELFNEIRGFDELLAVGFNDIDLCLRVREAGYKVLFDGHSVLHHYESATRSLSKQLAHPEDTALMRSRWAHLLAYPDPYFSPLFGTKAPASHSVVEPIDIYAPVRVWTKRSPVKSSQVLPRRIGTPQPVI